jgi:thiamine biosynthesis protein ThiC
MYNETKMLAFAKWYELLTDSDILMDAEERYDALLKLADEYRCRGVIDKSERNTLIELATAAYARSVTDLSA